MMVPPVERISLVQGDIVRQDTDVIVTAANAQLAGGGGVDGAVHRAAGPELLAACRALGGCPTGSARITPGFGLSAKWVVHAVGPIWTGAPQDDGRLASAYREGMRLAAAKGARSIAFPSISTGVYGFPVDRAAPIALRTVAEELAGAAATVAVVRFVLFDGTSFAAYEQALVSLRGIG